MGALRNIVCAVALVACADNPSPIDNVVGKDMKSDPWATLTSGGAQTKDGDDSGPFGGMDIKGMLQKIAESIEKPGPYEAPENSADFAADKPHFGVLALGGNIVEREAYSFSLFGGSERGTELRKLVERLRALAKQENLKGILVRAEPFDVSLPDVIELRAALHDLRKAGKTVACHTEQAANATYLVLAACERIGLAPLGNIAITGPAAMPIHVKPLLDKLGITADFLHVGAYKGAAEPLTREAPSSEMRETIQGILDRHYATTIEIVAADRELAPQVVQDLVDTALFTSANAKDAKLVDEVVAFEAFRDSVTANAAWTKLELSEKAESKDPMTALMQIGRFLGAFPPERPLGPHVAVVYALGNIVDGDGEGVLGAREEIASHTLVAALRAIAKDDDVKAVVLRIDSGGGSAQASELIWEAVAQVKAKKPVIVSMSDVAASGGYYIASGATKIFAQADTLTGSIGVVGGKLAPGAALAKLGVNTFPMGKGKRATMMASLSPWTPDEKAMMQAMMQDVYDVFVKRVADGRGKQVADVLPIAQGRVWTGAKAKELGLVDEIGGLDAALAEARTLAKLDATSEVAVYPPSPTLRDFFQGFGGGVSAPFGLDVLAALRTIDPAVAAAAEDMLRLVMSFQTTQIQTVALLPAIR